MSQSTLTLYKASAGSGKTFRLAVHYIALLVQNPEAYRSILAVTFTNKATAEMKQRILSQLYGISRMTDDESQNYFEAVRELVPASVSDRQIRENSGKALENILQDYGHFRIETIDSFFQSVLRGLARELQLGGSLALELDTDAVISDAVDTFLSELKSGSRESAQVIRFIEDNMDEGQNWSVDSKLKEFSSQLFRETFMQNQERLKKAMEKPGAVADFAAVLRDGREKKADEILKATISCGQKLMHEASAFDGALNANVNKLIDSIASGAFLDKNLGSTIENAIAGIQEKVLLSKTLGRNPALASLFKECMSPLFEEAKSLYTENVSAGRSYDAALKYLHEAGLLMDIRREINRQNEENGRFLLADTANLLGKLQDGDTSFVFEKTGSYIRHLMIDEFQDTSRLQWKNLCILLMECLSQGKSCLVVGDVKQSIYRWRDSDWNILNTEIENRTAIYNPVTVPLDQNRRSQFQIIDFNNKVFPKAVEILAERYRSEFGQPHPSLEKAYLEVEQKGSKGKDLGYVSVRLSSEDAPDMFTRIEAELDSLTGAGVKPSDITILCRRKKEISAIADYFQTVCTKYKVESGEAFRLDASVQVRIIVNLLRWLSDNNDTLSLTHALWEWHHYVMKDDASLQQILENGLEDQLPAELCNVKEQLKSLPLQELVTRLYMIMQLDRYEGQDAYTFSFIDTLGAWASRNAPDLEGFLKAWDDKLSGTSIPAAESDGIKLMTVHKAKGLQFHTVIIPYCNWEIMSYSSYYKPCRIWAGTDKEPFNEMPLIPVDFTSGLKDSVFNEGFKDEYAMQQVDNLNLLYVALTRAECNMCILCESKRDFNTGDLLRESMMQSGLVAAGQDEYSAGKIMSHKAENDEDKESMNPFCAKPAESTVTMKIHGLTAEFKQSGESERFVHSDAGAKQEEYIETGKLMHRLFSAIGTEADVDAEVQAILDEGLLGSRFEADALASKVHAYLQNPEVKDWFSGRYRLFNETAVIFRHNGILQTRRPDRVMTDGENAVVVDFKFGAEREDYMRQVREYMDLLTRMGYKKVYGYIWYVYLNKTINC